MGHFFYPHPIPVTETQKHSAYPGLLRAVEGARGGDARAVLHPVRPQRLLPARAVDHGEGRLQATSCRSARTCSAARAGAIWSGARRPTATSRRGAVPVMLDPDGVPGEAQLRPRRRSVRGDPGRDRQPARAQADVQRLHGRAGRLRRARRLPDEDARAADRRRSARRTGRPGWTTRKAKFLLGWRPRYDLARMTDAAYDYKRAPDDPRVVWYPG